MAAERDWSLLVAGAKKIPCDPGNLIDTLRIEYPDVVIQAADARAVYGQEHVIGAFCIAIEAHARKVMIANRLETEILLRLACTDQISEALKKTGLKPHRPGCFIALSKDQRVLKKFGAYLAQKFELDDSVLLPTPSKRARLAKQLRISKVNRLEFNDLLLERAAILVRS